jgi:transketolase
MRTAFIETLLKEAKTNPDIWLICGDLGFSVLEPFEKNFPSRFLNAGIAEQNMAGVAAGIASMNKTVLTYSIANFPTVRSLEQIRNDICYHNLNVKIVAVGSGFSYGALGYSHYGLEDIAIMKSLPNMTVLSPSDPYETIAAVEYMLKHTGPVYLRLGKSNESSFHNSPVTLSNKPEMIELTSGTDIAIIATGSIMALALDIAKDLKQQHNITSSVASSLFISPFDSDYIKLQSKQKRLIVSIEEHGKGGLFSSISEILSTTQNRSCNFMPFYITSCPTKAGSQEYLRHKAGLSKEIILPAILKELNA